MILEHLVLATLQHGSNVGFAKNQPELPPYVCFLFYSYLSAQDFYRLTLKIYRLQRSKTAVCTLNTGERKKQQSKQGIEEFHDSCAPSFLNSQTRMGSESGSGTNALFCLISRAGSPGHVSSCDHR